jgi:hypothetical protein
LFPRALLHTTMISHVIKSKFGLGTPHFRLEQDIADQGMALDRGTMSRYVEHAGNALGATIVQAMWADAIAHAQVISTDATGALIQPARTKDGRPQACKKGHLCRARHKWPRDRYLELSPKYWRATRARLNPKELEAPLSSFEIPPPLGEPVEPPVEPSG